VKQPLDRICFAGADEGAASAHRQGEIMLPPAKSAGSSNGVYGCETDLRRLNSSPRMQTLRWQPQSQSIPVGLQLPGAVGGPHNEVALFRPGQQR
jgi:hypothetical protein